MSARAVLVLMVFMTVAPAAWAQTRAAPAEFVVRDLRVEGLQRISEGTVYNYLPINPGDRLTRARAEEALRALYATKFFKDIVTQGQITVDNDGKQTRDFIYVGDLCWAVLLALKSNVSGEVFQIATGVETSIG